MQIRDPRESGGGKTFEYDPNLSYQRVLGGPPPHSSLRICQPSASLWPPHLLPAISEIQSHDTFTGRSHGETYKRVEIKGSKWWWWAPIPHTPTLFFGLQPPYAINYFVRILLNYSTGRPHM